MTLFRKSVTVTILLATLSAVSCTNNNESSLEYLLVKFEGDDNWSLINSDGEVEKRNELATHRAPTLVREGFFIADSGYYHVDNLKSPAFYDEHMKTGTLFYDGTAITVNEYEGGERYFNFIGYDGKTNDKGAYGYHKASRPAHGYFYTYNSDEKKIVSSVKTITENPRGNTILGPELTGTIYRDTYTDEIIYTAYKGPKEIGEEPAWETTDQLVNFEKCWLDGYFIKRTDDGHLVVLDLELNELFSNPEAYIYRLSDERVCYEAYLGDKVIFCADPYSPRYGLMATDGTVLMQADYSNICHLGDNVFAVQRYDENEYAGGYLTDEKGTPLTSTKISVSSTTQLCDMFKHHYDGDAKLGEYYLVSIINEDGSDELVLINSKGQKASMPAKISQIATPDTDPIFTSGRIHYEFKKRENAHY